MPKVCDHGNNVDPASGSDCLMCMIQRGLTQQFAGMEAAREKVKHDLAIILREAEAHGTLDRLPQVAIYFNEMELRCILAALCSNSTTPN
jgi:hypothetical protein